MIIFRGREARGQTRLEKTLLEWFLNQEVQLQAEKHHHTDKNAEVIENKLTSEQKFSSRKTFGSEKF